jgi:hypothetical protein
VFYSDENLKTQQTQTDTEKEIKTICKLPTQIIVVTFLCFLLAFFLCKVICCIESIWYISFIRLICIKDFSYCLGFLKPNTLEFEVFQNVFPSPFHWTLSRPEAFVCAPKINDSMTFCYILSFEHRKPALFVDLSHALLTKHSQKL